MHIYSIYRATNKVNNKCYIGFDSSWPRRRISHKCAAKTSNIKFYRAIRKYGWDNFVWEIIYQSTDRDHTLHIMEPHFIAEYNSFQLGYNSTAGGEGVQGHTRVMPEEEKRRRSSVAKGKPKSQEHRANMKGRVWSGESRLKASIAAKARGNKPLSAETRRKISESNKGKHTEVYTCPHCGKHGKSNAMLRWHFDNCPSHP